jgi:hypothetical protein
MARMPPAAHSTCGHSADGAEWTYKTPRVEMLTGSSCWSRCAFPSGLACRWCDEQDFSD